MTRVFDLRPAAIIDELDYSPRFMGKLLVYGHFGRPELLENTDKAADLRAAVEER